jgi:hypothetical protein
MVFLLLGSQDVDLPKQGIPAHNISTVLIPNNDPSLAMLQELLITLSILDRWYDDRVVAVDPDSLLVMRNGK